MIFVWLWKLGRFLICLVIPPRRSVPLPHIEPEKAPCPACGSVGMEMRYVIISTNPGKADAIRKGLLQMTCPKCKAFYRIEPLFKRMANENGTRQTGPDEVDGKELKGLPL